MEEFQYSDCEDSIDEVISFTGECNYKSQPVDHDVQLTCVTQAAKHLKHPSIISRDNRLLELIQLMGKQIQVPPSDVSRYYALLYELARDYCKAFKHQSSDQGKVDQLKKNLIEQGLGQGFYTKDKQKEERNYKFNVC